MRFCATSHACLYTLAGLHSERHSFFFRKCDLGFHPQLVRLDCRVSMKRVLKCTWGGFIWLRTRFIVTCEHRNEPSASIVDGECMLAERTSAFKDAAMWC